MTTQPAQAQSAATVFENAVERSLSELQAALVGVVEGLPVYPKKAPDLARALGLERNVAWKLFRLMNERDVFAAAKFVPGAASMAVFVTAAAAAGVSDEACRRVSEAARAYESVVRTHAGDRASADIMLGPRVGDVGGGGGELALRRAAYRANSLLAGVQAEAQLQTFMFAPSEKGGGVMHGVSLNGFVNLRRMRPGAPIVIGRSMATDDHGNLLKPEVDGSIDGPLPPGEYVPLLKDFCSTPLPRFRQMKGDRGFVDNELEDGPVGKTGATTFMAGMVIRNMASRYRDAQNSNMDLVARVRTPVEALVCDVLAHEEVFGDAPARMSIFNDLFGNVLARGPGRERYQLSPTQPVERLGRGVEAVRSPEIPRYPRMIEHVMGRLGWDASRFFVYRVRIEYPFTPTSVVVSFDLVEPPTPRG